MSQIHSINKGAVGSDERRGTSVPAATVERSPLIHVESDGDEICKCTFLFEGNSSTRCVSLDLPPFSRAEPENFKLKNTSNSHLWTITVDLPVASRFSYSFLENFEGEQPNAESDPDLQKAFRIAQRADVLNPDKDCRNRSFFETPGAQTRYLPTIPVEGPRGTVREYSLRSRHLNNDREISIYRMPKDEKVEPRSVIIFFDDKLYLNEINTPSILDSLFNSSQLTGVSAVFVGNAEGQREKDLVLNPSLPAFLFEELIPFVEHEIKGSIAPGSLYFAGASFGALAALYAAAQPSDLIGGVIAQSASLWKCQERLDELKGPVDGYKTHLECGVYETQSMNGITLLDANRAFAADAKADGINIDYYEYNGGHGAVHWRESLPDALLNIVSRRQNAITNQ